MAIAAAPPAPGLTVELALAHAARAATSWFGGQESSRSAALAQLMMSMSFVRRAVAGDPGWRKPHEFIALLEQPAASWLPGAPDLPLVEAGAPSAFCEDLIAESGGEPEAELVQLRVGEARQRFGSMPNGEDEYRRFREYLATHGWATQLDAARAVVRSGVPLAELYEAVPRECLQTTGTKPVFFPCPRCKWPMRISSDRTQCAAAECRALGSIFRSGSGKLVALGRRAAPAPIPAEGNVRLRRGAWRYTLLPGLVELDLARRLRRVDGVSVVLWPQRDRYDLHVARGQRSWRVDLKAWSDALALARRLIAKPPESGTFIVVPDRSRAQVRVLEERCLALNCHFLSASQFVRVVESRPSRGRKS